jgi:hypothetical protein
VISEAIDLLIVVVFENSLIFLGNDAGHMTRQMKSVFDRRKLPMAAKKVADLLVDVLVETVWNARIYFFLRGFWEAGR